MNILSQHPVEYSRNVETDVLGLFPSTVASPTPVSTFAGRQLAEMLAQGIYPLMQQYMSYQKAEADTCLWHEGDDGNSMVLILSGRVETLKETEFPEHPFVTGIYSAGTVVGEDGFLNDLPRSTTVRVLETCELLILSRESFDQLEKSQPAVANLILKWVLNLITSRLHNAQKRLATIF